MRPFEPLFPDPHLLTILGSFWPRPMDRRRFPEVRRYYRTEPGVEVLAVEQRPCGTPRGELVLLHGLEGSHEGGYMVSLAQAALEAGFRACRLNTRSCGGTEARSRTLYHGGLTADLIRVLEAMHREDRGPVIVVGFSLGGNVALKFAGELGDSARRLVAAVCVVSTPLDLAECAREIDKPTNLPYRLRFVRDLKQRYVRRHRANPTDFPALPLSRVHTVTGFDDLVTAPAFGLGTAANYYATQSALNFLDGIRIPALLIQAKDDPMIPYRVYERAGLGQNPYLRLLAVDHGGHLGFLNRRAPRFWVDEVILDWVGSITEQIAPRERHLER